MRASNREIQLSLAQGNSLLYLNIGKQGKKLVSREESQLDNQLFEKK